MLFWCLTAKQGGVRNRKTNVIVSSTLAYLLLLPGSMFPKTTSSVLFLLASQKLTFALEAGDYCNSSIQITEYPFTVQDVISPTDLDYHRDNVCSTFMREGRWYSLKGDGNCYSVMSDKTDAIRHVHIMKAAADADASTVCGNEEAMSCVSKLLTFTGSQMNGNLFAEEGNTYYFSVSSDEAMNLTIRVRFHVCSLDSIFSVPYQSNLSISSSLSFSLADTANLLSQRL